MYSTTLRENLLNSKYYGRPGIQSWITLGPALKELMVQMGRKIISRKLIVRDKYYGEKKTEMEIATEII